MLSKTLILTILSRIGIIISGIGVAIVTARTLGPYGRGEYYYAITLANIIALIASCGMQTSNIFYVAQNKQILDKLIVNSLWLTIFGCGTFSILLVVSIYLFSSEASSSTMWSVILLAPLNLFFLFGINLLVGLQRFRAFNIYQIIMNAMTLIVVFIACIISKSAFVALISLAIVWFVINYFLIKSLTKTIDINFLKFDRVIFKKSFRYASKAFIVTISAYLLSRSSVFFLAHYSSFEEIGFFSVSSQIADTLNLLPMTAGVFLLPNLVKFNDSKDEVLSRTLKTTGIISLAMVIICLVIYVASLTFVKIIFGNLYIDSIRILNIMLIGCCFSSSIQIINQYFAIYEYPWYFVRFWMLSVVVNVFLCFYFIPQYAASGAALAFSISYMFLFIACFIAILNIKKNRNDSKTKMVLIKNESIIN